jgi:ABC-2 type transport system permease protein
MGGVLPMGVYIELIKKTFKSMFVYRLNTIMYFITSILFFLVQVSVWSALLGKGAVDGVSLKDMITLLIVNRIIGSVIRSNSIGELSNMIENGSITDCFIRPISLKLNIISKAFGDNLFMLVFNTIPVCIVIAVFYGFSLPASGINFLLFCISTVIGMMLYLTMEYTVGLLTFWFKSGNFLDWFFGAAMSLFAGSVVPLWFFPDILAKVAYALPFRHIFFTPVSIYLGKISVYESIEGILIQCLWAAVLIALEHFTWTKAQRVVTVHGG